MGNQPTSLNISNFKAFFPENLLIEAKQALGLAVPAAGSAMSGIELAQAGDALRKIVGNSNGRVNRGVHGSNLEAARARIRGEVPHLEFAKFLEALAQKSPSLAAKFAQFITVTAADAAVRNNQGQFADAERGA